MTGEGIYLIQENGGLLELTERPYESEELLQQLLERYPSRLTGRQMNPAEPRRWILVTREAGMPSRLGGSAQWSADHVFLDQAAVPTIVEVKRSSDTRIRREVVGQMLDYAANAVVLAGCAWCSSPTGSRRSCSGSSSSSTGRWTPQKCLRSSFVSSSAVA